MQEQTVGAFVLQRAQAACDTQYFLGGNLADGLFGFRINDFDNGMPTVVIDAELQIPRQMLYHLAQLAERLTDVRGLIRLCPCGRRHILPCLHSSLPLCHRDGRLFYRRSRGYRCPAGGWCVNNPCL